MALTSLRVIYYHNLFTFRSQPISEISGSLGDLGTFLPIVVALTEGHQISLTTTLIFTGIFNILTGICFGIPLPVQPMKAIAAISILKSLNSGEVAAAGLFVASCILILSVTGLLSWITRVVPIPVVKGIQVGAGLSLIIAAGTKVLADLSWTSPTWADNYIWVIVAFLALLISTRLPRTPYALFLLVLGLIFAGIQLQGSGPAFQTWHPYVQVPTTKEWRNGISQAGIGQLPLTTLNSIVAVTHLAADLLPEVATPSVTSIGLSVAGMNLFGIWFGAMPVCHGSGGLAAQYRFGARSGASIILLGLVKLLIGLLFGESLSGLLESYPKAFLSVLIIAAGVELASVGESLNTNRARDLQKHEHRGDDIEEAERKQRWTVMLVTAGLLVAFKNDAIGFVAGLCCHWSYTVPEYLSGLRRRKISTGIRLGGTAENEALLEQSN